MPIKESKSPRHKYIKSFKGGSVVGNQSNAQILQIQQSQKPLRDLLKQVKNN